MYIYNVYIYTFVIASNEYANLQLFRSAQYFRVNLHIIIFVVKQ